MTNTARQDDPGRRGRDRRRVRHRAVRRAGQRRARVGWMTTTTTAGWPSSLRLISGGRSPRDAPLGEVQGKGRPLGHLDRVAAGVTQTKRRSVMKTIDNRYEDSA